MAAASLVAEGAVSVDSSVVREEQEEDWVGEVLVYTSAVYTSAMGLMGVVEMEQVVMVVGA